MSPTPQRNDTEAVIEGNYTTFADGKTRTTEKYLVVKRMMDFTLAFIGLAFLSPLFIIVSILIKLEDPKGSVFFYQTRVGKDEKPFRMYKFRSMVTNAEELLENLLDRNEIKGAMFKIKDDPRITRIGGFIRRTSIDELPQLWNVIRGDMSLVGPRPPLPREVEEYTAYDKKRLSILPGCTGLWQVSGRNRLGFKEMVELDLEYIHKRNIGMDIKILIKTARALRGSQDAY
ncbi:sugar transferase [Paenibacillus protaetiae]|uniref:Sugar transferase n=1 Tax=Paenibacillus protaetiae TaxID=2509456 RepID=A0A4V0YF79_9BACL|nr:sugar transferase [Paenibacillus protaetiae]QAY66771.1 sugar transferase [Paenibacillus protaetiae]